MGLFGLGNKKNKTLDLTQRYAKQQERLSNMKEDMASNKTSPEMSDSSSNGLGFFASMASSAKANDSTQSSYPGMPSANSMNDNEEKRRRFTKRIMDLTDKVEELSNQIYHLQQRIEVLERKNKSGFE
jgi:hypothetical protein